MNSALHLHVLIKILLLLWLGTAGVFCSAASVVYVANADSHTISVFSLNETSGQLNLRQTLAVEGAVMPMALSHGQRLLYAAVRSTPYQLMVLGIDDASGELSLRAKLFLADSMANISVDAAGRYLFAVSYAGNTISSYPLNTQGVPSSPVQVLPTGNHPHQITTDPQQQYVYVSLLGEHRVDYFRLNHRLKSAPLVPMNRPALQTPSGAGPRHFVFSAQGLFLYLVNELSGTVQVYQRNVSNGTATPVENHVLAEDVKPWAADIHLTPNGKFLYASERTSSTISSFKVNRNTGRLSPIGRWATEQQPRAFRITPDGRFLLVVGQLSQRMSVYAINPRSGKLQLVSTHETGKNPAWIEVVNLPVPAR